MFVENRDKMDDQVRLILCRSCSRHGHSVTKIRISWNIERDDVKWNNRPEELV